MGEVSKFAKADGPKALRASELSEIDSVKKVSILIDKEQGRKEKGEGRKQVN
jgi:hypothetical protein